MQESVTYLGFCVSVNRLSPTKDKLKAMAEAPSPNKAQQLHSFLGLLNYYGRFIPNLSTMLQPLNVLLKEKVKWEWSNKCV